MSDDQRKVAGAAGLLAASVLIARGLGLLRDMLLASQVGRGPGLDAYFAAFMIPDILGYLLAAGAVAVAVTPPYVKRLQHEGEEAAALGIEGTGARVVGVAEQSVEVEAQSLTDPQGDASGA